jgi:hypothetical protein
MPTGVYTRTIEHRNKLSLIFKGRKFSKEWRDKINKSLHNNPKLQNRIPWNKGKPCSEETKQKIGKANYKHGRYYENGYIQILCKNHPFANNRGYVRKHRLVVEKYIGRYLKPSEDCHHINGIRNDNRLKNLIVFKNRKAHIYFEWNEKINTSDIIFDGREIQ